MLFKLRFVGRRAGALGISYAHAMYVEAENREAAKLRAHDTHEHIYGAVAEPSDETNPPPRCSCGAVVAP